MMLRPLRRKTITLFILPLACLTTRQAAAQEKPVKDLPPFSARDFTLPASPAVDSSSSAVILANFGDIRFIGNKDSWFSHVFRVHKRVKILNKTAFDAATVRVDLYTPGQDEEKLDRLTASTYNMENGQLSEVKLDKKDIYTDRIDKNYSEVKWTMPAVKEGSIIDFSYEITSDYNMLLPTWRFQSSRFPCLWSELQVDIPQTLMYVMVKQGVHPYSVDKGSEASESFRMSTKAGGWMVVAATTERHHWVMKDIPAFQREPFLTSDENYLDKIDFQLARTYNGEDYQDVFNSWKQATEELLARDDFGKNLDDDSRAVDNAEQEAVGGAEGTMAQAKAIYYYVAGKFTCTDYYDKYIRSSLTDVVRKRSGTVGEINLLLITMLRKLGVKADPVVLSTREFGFNLASYPALDRLNYVIARAVINGNIIYLDAAHPMLGFGQLDEACYNGHARVISNTDSASIYFDSDSLKERSSTGVFVHQTDKGVEGTWESLLGLQKSYDLREQIAGKGQESYFKDIQTRFGDDISISDGGIDSLNALEKPVKVHYSFKLKQPDGESKIYVNPFIGGGLLQNPFKAAERKYPIEMPYGRDDLYVFTMQIPDGYSVEELPKSIRASLNGSDGSFEYLCGAENGMIQIRCRLKLNKANFPAGDYVVLRNFYALVVSKEGESIVLKKN